MTITDALERHRHLLEAGDHETTDQMWARAGQFTNNVCYDLRDRYALIKKSGGRVCGGGHDCDKIVERAVPYRIYDLVASAGSHAAQPVFNQEHVNGKPSDFYEPLPYEAEPPIPPVPPVCPPTFDYPDENTVGKAFQVRVKQAYTDAGRPFPDPTDQDAFRHFMRFGYSCRSMPATEAADKHLAELRAQLGV